MQSLMFAHFTKTCLLISCFLFFNISPTTSHAPYTIIYKWKVLDFVFPSAEARTESIKNGSFVPKNVGIGGIRVWKDQIYAAIPRFRPGTPLALATAPYSPTTKHTKIGYALKPYPNWAMQELENCNALQMVQNLEIDQYGRMWIIDTGRVYLFTDKPINVCKPKLVIIDVETGNVLRTYLFPESVASAMKTYFYSITVACKCEDNCFVYISDVLQFQIVVYSYQKNRSWSVSHKSMEPDPAVTNVTTNGVIFSAAGYGVDSVNVSPIDQNFDRLFYCPYASYNFYSVSTKVLKKASRRSVTKLKDSDIEDHGKGKSIADGRSMDSAGLLYYGRVLNNSLAVWNTKYSKRSPSNDIVYRHSDVNMEYVDQIAFDNVGNIVFTADKLNVILSDIGAYNPDVYNIRILRTHAIGNRQSYKYKAFG